MSLEDIRDSCKLIDLFSTQRGVKNELFFTELCSSLIYLRLQNMKKIEKRFGGKRIAL